MPTKRTFLEELEHSGWFLFELDGVVYAVDTMGFAIVIDNKQYVCHYAIAPFNNNEKWKPEGLFNTIDELLEYRLENGALLKDRLTEIKNITSIPVG